MKNIPIIDTHCHIYPEKIASRAVAGTDNFYGIKSALDGTVSTLIKEEQKAGICHSVVCSVATTPHQVASINEFIASEVQKNPKRLTGIGTLHPDSEDMKADIEHILALGLKGVKLHPDIQQFKLDDYRCLKIYELCEGRLPILIHTGDSRYDYSNPNRLMPILDTYTELEIIGAHLGGYSIWTQAAHQLSGYKNFYVDCSSSFAFIDKETAKNIIYQYGCDKVLFGTDYPMWQPQTELENLISLGLAENEYESILYKNAKKLFEIGEL